MKKNFVTFYSPGTFVSEESTKPIETWDVDLAISMAKEIVARYDATPYGFQFSTRERGEGELDSHETGKSPFYYLGGEIFTLEQLKDIGSPDDEILISNMEINKWNKVIVNTNSWKTVQIFNDNDIILPFTK